MSRKPGRNHKQLNITIPNELYDWLESERVKTLTTRSRFVSECLRDVLYINSNVSIDNEITKEMRIVKGV